MFLLTCFIEKDIAIVNAAHDCQEYLNSLRLGETSWHIGEGGYIDTFAWLPENIGNHVFCFILVTSPNFLFSYYLKLLFIRLRILLQKKAHGKMELKEKFILVQKFWGFVLFCAFPMNFLLTPPCSGIALVLKYSDSSKQVATLMCGQCKCWVEQWLWKNSLEVSSNVIKIAIVWTAFPLLGIYPGEMKT